MKTLIIPDINGKPDLLRKMLECDADRIIQLGDLANCVWLDSAGDLECLDIAYQCSFEMLVGNHEHPYFGGTPFSDFGFLPEVKDAISNLEWKAAAEVNGTLITHAGLHPAIATRYKSAKDAADDLNRAWQQFPTASLFNAIGRIRGGRYDYGGILWRDYEERVSQKFPQVFGHTKGKAVRRRNHAICIDCKQPYIIEN